MCDKNDLSFTPLNVSFAFDDTACELGEGPLWHPTRQSLFWFDIVNKKLFMRSLDSVSAMSWSFSEMVSAAGWIDCDNLLIASETQLFRFNLISGDSETLVDLEQDNLITRSNDGRADPWGGFWIGTMGKHAEQGAGSIYRFYQGELHTIVTDITISNAICFSSISPFAFYTDTPSGVINRIRLDPKTGSPVSSPETFIDLNDRGLNPDGMIVDSTGNLLLACWGDYSIHVFDPDGHHIGQHTFPAAQISCPALGGPDLNILFATSAYQGLERESRTDSKAGRTYGVRTNWSGVPEPAVVLK